MKNTFGFTNLVKKTGDILQIWKKYKSAKLIRGVECGLLAHHMHCLETKRSFSTHRRQTQRRGSKLVTQLNWHRQTCLMIISTDRWTHRRGEKPTHTYPMAALLCWGNSSKLRNYLLVTLRGRRNGWSERKGEGREERKERRGWGRTISSDYVSFHHRDFLHSLTSTK